MPKDLQGKTIVLGITGGIAAYKMPNVAHALAKRGADVHVLMTKNATEFIAPLVFETLTNPPLHRRYLRPQFPVRRRPCFAGQTRPTSC